MNFLFDGIIDRHAGMTKSDVIKSSYPKKLLKIAPSLFNYIFFSTFFKKRA